METDIIGLAAADGWRRALEAGVETLKRGGVVVIPTDTVYGLAVDGKNREAVEKVYRIKGRPAGKPLVRLVADRSEILPLLHSPGAARLLEKFWPGPLTVILETPEGKTRGFRMPAHGLVRELIRESGVELAATSANRSGDPVVTSPGEAAALFSGQAELIIDGGELSGLASTVLDLSVSPPRLLREGPVKRADLFRVLDQAVV
ncbi:MAG: L-threonylcarbamoyladenylate synthase [Candidatus Erginobacter occultus]|nr:L-threonylcarbamoyladenylate synthase [Candidatus Erginobacter occultus]